MFSYNSFTELICTKCNQTLDPFLNLTKAGAGFIACHGFIIASKTTSSSFIIILRSLLSLSCFFMTPVKLYILSTLKH